MFKSTARGFSIRFDNGYEASVQFGQGNYCANRYNKEAVNLSHAVTAECRNAEVGCFDSNDNPIQLGGEDDIWMGNRSPKEVLEILNRIANL